MGLIGRGLMNWEQEGRSEEPGQTWVLKVLDITKSYGRSDYRG